MFYYEAHAFKGNGVGSSLGKTMKNVEKYMAIYVKAADVYNQCDLDYYMIAIGDSLTTVSGFANFSVNFLWRWLAEDDLYDDLADGLAAKDFREVGRDMGTFIKILTAAEIPDADLDLGYSFIENYTWKAADAQPVMSQ